MKRSKVVELIASWGKPEILDDVYSKNYEEWADNLLHVLTEELEMAPPPYIDPIIGDHMDFYEVRKWESEDEKK